MCTMMGGHEVLRFARVSMLSQNVLTLKRGPSVCYMAGRRNVCEMKRRISQKRGKGREAGIWGNLNLNQSQNEVPNVGGGIASSR